MSDPALPTRWPSAWPDLWPTVALRAALPLTACLATLAGLGWLGDLSLSWWVPLLPALLLIRPLRWPARVRRGFDSAAETGRLRVTDEAGGSLVWGGLGAVAATVDASGAVHYVGTRRR